MGSRIEELAAQIAAMDEKEQQALLERAAEIAFRQGLADLSERYRKRLQQHGDLDEDVETVLTKLRLIREEIALREYP